MKQGSCTGNHNHQNAQQQQTLQKVNDPAQNRMITGQNQTADTGDSGFAGQLQQCQIYQKKQSGG